VFEMPLATGEDGRIKIMLQCLNCLKSHAYISAKFPKSLWVDVHRG